MDAHYDSQIRQQYQQPAFHGPARQFGPGGMGAFAMRMGRVAMPLMRKYVLPVAKEIGKNLVSAFVPELSNEISGKKRPRKAFKDTIKHSAAKTLSVATDRPASGAAGRTVRNGASGRRSRDGGPSVPRTAWKNDNGSSKVKSQSAPRIISKKTPAKRSRSDILSNVAFTQQ